MSGVSLWVIRACTVFICGLLKLCEEGSMEKIEILVLMLLLAVFCDYIQ